MKSQPGRRSCRACGKPLIFVVDASGKIQPLDPAPPTWRIDRYLTGEEVAIRADALVSHFSTCPKADQFSSARRKHG